MQLGKILVEMSEEGIARNWALAHNCQFISNQLIDELLSVPDINARMLYKPKELAYVQNVKSRSAGEGY